MGQLSNGIVKYSNPLDKKGTYEVMKIPLDRLGCSTPHLVRMIPRSNLATTGCRCTNPGEICTGKVAVFDITTGKAKTLEAGPHSEGITVTQYGDVWVGSNKGDFVSVFGFKNDERTVDNFYLKKKIAGQNIKEPLRLAYDQINDL